MRIPRWPLPVALLAGLAGLTAPAPARTSCDDTISARVTGSTITIQHDGAFYNCCVGGFDYVVTEEPGLFTVVENEIVGEPCDCLCCYDLTLTIEDVAPGDWVIVFRWRDSETGDWLQVELPVTVGDVGQGGAAVFAGYVNGGCHDPTDVPGPVASSWGSVKSSYR
jgi:hypothetical protein